MKKMKKILAFVMAMAMVLGMSVTSLAANTKALEKDVPSNQDNGTIKISGLKENDTVNIYKIVKANYGDDGEGFTGYESVHYTIVESKKTPMIADVKAPKADEIVKLLAHVKGTEHTDCDAGQFSDSKQVAEKATEVEFSNLAVGTYLVEVIAGDGSTTVYNPMVASVYYVTEDGQDKIDQGSVDASTANWVIGGDIVYAKSSDDNDITKTIVEGGRSTGNGVGKGDDVAVGTTVKFAIEGTIPSYDKEYYTNPTYVITDTLSEGLDFTVVAADPENGVVAKTAQEVLQEQANAIFGENNSTVVVTGRSFTLTVKPDYLKTLASMPANNQTTDNAATSDRTFKFVYSAVVNGAEYNFDPSTNTAQVEYSNTPSTTTTGDEKKTYHYTFSLGTLLTVKGNISTKTTNIIQKVDSVTGKILSTDTTIEETDEDYTKVAAGAEFELKHNTTNKIYTATSDDKGQLKFEGLDAGEYTLKETKAPTGYTLSEVTYPVVITPEYNNDGRLSKLTITINGKETLNFTADYSSGEMSITEPTEEQYKENVSNIPNTTLSSLPSTGGIGTTIFTIGGCAIMIVAAGLFFASRRKSSK